MIISESQKFDINQSVIYNGKPYKVISFSEERQTYTLRGEVVIYSVPQNQIHARGYNLKRVPADRV